MSSLLKQTNIEVRGPFVEVKVYDRLGVQMLKILKNGKLETRETFVEAKVLIAKV